MLQDISSLLSHTNYCFERLEYLQDTVMGLINLEQNKIMKILGIMALSCVIVFVLFRRKKLL